MERERTKRDLVRLRRPPLEDVCFDTRNFRVIDAQFYCYFQRGGLSIKRIDLNFCADLSRKIDNQSRNVARARGKIDNAQAVARSNPATDEPENNRMTPKVMVQLSEIPEIALQFGRDRLRSIH